MGFWDMFFPAKKEEERLSRFIEARVCDECGKPLVDAWVLSPLESDVCPFCGSKFFTTKVGQVRLISKGGGMAPHWTEIIGFKEREKSPRETD